jgi:hypothetical protein
MITKKLPIVLLVSTGDSDAAFTGGLRLGLEGFADVRYCELEDRYDVFATAFAEGGPALVAFGCITGGPPLDSRNAGAEFIRTIRKTAPHGPGYMGPIIGLCPNCYTVNLEAGVDEVCSPYGENSEAVARISEILSGPPDLERCARAIRAFFRVRSEFEDVDLSRIGRVHAIHDAENLMNKGREGLRYSAGCSGQLKLGYQPERGFELNRNGMDPDEFLEFQQAVAAEFARVGLPFHSHPS